VTFSRRREALGHSGEGSILTVSSENNGQAICYGENRAESFFIGPEQEKEAYDRVRIRYDSDAWLPTRFLRSSLCAWLWGDGRGL
jgi:hypothetical protein